MLATLAIARSEEGLLRGKSGPPGKAPIPTERVTEIVRLTQQPPPHEAKSLPTSPAHAVVVSVDKKSQIKALDRTQPGLPMKKVRAGTVIHNYKRNGTTTLFAALNVLDGTVIGQTRSVTAIKSSFGFWIAWSVRCRWTMPSP